MGRHQLQNGREIYLERFSMDSTYGGMMEGSPEDVSQSILERLPERAKRILAPAMPLVVVTPSRMPLPSWLCVAELKSRSGARQVDPDFISSLYACWFSDDTACNIDVMVDSILFHLDWERLAEDVNLMDF